ncbi:hypothetical protein B0H17DRAFT_1211544 [Mycena rosella]|uniref:Uncharacterized protein n=1 Tax=Mycena rosella TaxID=1033263 RepID=A0AAD7CU26_MYCRO|nr:hypothetical protein B0H17DRAFT_1211544 [Mycena rosella]
MMSHPATPSKAYIPARMAQPPASPGMYMPTPPPGLSAARPPDNATVCTPNGNAGAAPSAGTGTQLQPRVPLIVGRRLLLFCSCWDDPSGGGCAGCDCSCRDCGN